MSSPFRLRVEGGPHLGQTFVVERSGVTIGRQDGNDIVLDDARLSRQHARLDLRDGGLVVTDLGSANGTLVNGRRITGSQPLRPGDSLQLGESKLVIEPPVGGARAAPTGPLVQRDARTVTGPPEVPAARPPNAGRPRLVLQNGIHAGREHPLDRDIVVVGRHEGGDIVLDDTQASRRHAQLTIRDGQVSIADLGSANGTRVNGQQISGSRPLQPGDMVQIGTSLLRFDAGATVPPAPAPPPVGAARASAPTVPAAGPPPPPPAWAPGAPGVPGAPPPTPAYPAPLPSGPPASIIAPPAGGVPARRGARWPLILVGVLALLLVCATIPAAAYLLLRNRAGSEDGRTTAATTPGTAAVLSSPAAIASPIPGSGGANLAPPPPGSTPTLAITPTPAGAAPTAAPGAAGGAPQPTQPARSAPATTPGRTATARQPAGGAPAGQIYTNEQWGFRLALPSGWALDDDEADFVSFVAPSGRARFYVNFAAPRAGLTAAQRLQLELDAATRTDPAFQPARVQITDATLGGQPAARTSTYGYTQGNGVRVAEADYAVVIPARAVYLFAAIAPQEDFNAHVSEFQAIIDSITFIGP